MTADKTNEGEVYNLRFGVHRSIRYHHRRAAFFGGLHRVAMFVNLFVALFAGVSAVQGYGFLALGLTVFVAFIAALDATADSANNCAKHMMLAYRFQDLDKRLLAGKEILEQDYKVALQERIAIEQDEPVSLRLLDAMCHYELLISMGDDNDRMPKIPIYRKFWAQFATQTEFAQSLKDSN